MALNQPLKNFPLTPLPTLSNDSPGVARAVQLGELVLSVSTMLGCDYIFVSHKGPHSLLEQKRIRGTIRELLDMLDTSPHKSLVVSADETPAKNLAFTRYDYTWENRKVTNITASRVSNAEQVDFMQMMFDCSTTC